MHHFTLLHSTLPLTDVTRIDAILQDWKIILKSETDNPISRAATLEENIDYILNIGGRTLKTDKLTNSQANI